MRPTDEEIERRIRDALAIEPHLARPDIGVTVAGGVATLEGEVATAERRRRAEETARRVEGVVDVRNNLHVMSLREGSYEVERISEAEDGL